VYFWQRRISRYFYIRQLWDIIFLLLIFLREIIKSCFLVMRLVFTPGHKMRSILITYETELTTPWQVILLSNMITISPGSFVIDISPDNKVLLIHVFDSPDAETFQRGIRTHFEDNIRRATR
jgi:multicomponent Na+:H+ antiporter subunit E